jgi:hypothetical protein
MGLVTVTQAIQLIDQIVSDPTFRKGMNSLCDFTQGGVSWSIEDLDTFRTYVNRIKGVTGKCKWAILFDPGADTSTARMFTALHGALGDTIVVKVFSDRMKAVAWLQSGDRESR